MTNYLAEKRMPMSLPSASLIGVHDLVVAEELLYSPIQAFVALENV